MAFVVSGAVVMPSTADRQRARIDDQLRACEADIAKAKAVVGRELARIVRLEAHFDELLDMRFKLQDDGR